MFWHCQGTGCMVLLQSHKRQPHTGSGRVKLGPAAVAKQPAVKESSVHIRQLYTSISSFTSFSATSGQLFTSISVIRRQILAGIHTFTSFSVTQDNISQVPTVSHDKSSKHSVPFELLFDKAIFHTYPERRRTNLHKFLHFRKFHC